MRARFLSGALAVVFIAAAAAAARADEQILVLKDGRKITVTSIFRRNGQVFPVDILFVQA